MVNAIKNELHQTLFSCIGQIAKDSYTHIHICPSIIYTYNISNVTHTLGQVVVARI
jgi:hypothetical protein